MSMQEAVLLLKALSPQRQRGLADAHVSGKEVVSLRKKFKRST